MLRIVPNEQEVKALREYDRDKKPIELLSEEDKFVYYVSVLDKAKLNALFYVNNILRKVFIRFNTSCRDES